MTDKRKRQSKKQVFIDLEVITTTLSSSINVKMVMIAIIRFFLSFINLTFTKQYTLLHFLYILLFLFLVRENWIIELMSDLRIRDE